MVKPGNIRLLIDAHGFDTFATQTLTMTGSGPWTCSGQTPLLGDDCKESGVVENEDGRRSGKKNVLILCSLILLTSAMLGDKISMAEFVELKKFAQGAYSTFGTVYNTHQLARRCLSQQIPGDFVECGVANGAQVAAMGLACQSLNDSTKKIHLFDSFQGIPLAGPYDEQQPGIGPITHGVTSANPEDYLVSSGVSAASIQQVKANMAYWKIQPERLVYHKGWFQHTLPLNTIDQIAFLRLDGDLYESTKVCLEYLYPKISKGGYIVIDDYALPGCAKAVNEYLAKYNLKPKIRKVPKGLGPVYWKKE